MTTGGLIRDSEKTVMTMPSDTGKGHARGNWVMSSVGRDVVWGPVRKARDTSLAGPHMANCGEDIELADSQMSKNLQVVGV